MSTISYQFLVRIELRVVVPYSIFFTHFRKSQFSENSVFTDTRITEVPHHYTLIFLPISQSEEESITLVLELANWPHRSYHSNSLDHRTPSFHFYTQMFFTMVLPTSCKYKPTISPSTSKKILILLNTTYISIPIFQTKFPL